MNTVLGAALEVQQVLTSRRERFCIIGGLALQRWGKPRVTRDIDVTVLCPFGEEGAAADRLLAVFPPRIAEARDFALRNRVLLLQSEGGIPVDVALGGLPYEERCVARSSEWKFTPEAVLRTCSAEDLIVLKAFAGRPQDWVDIESVVIRMHRELDWTLLFDELSPLVALRESPETLDRLRQLRESPERRA